MLLFCPVCSNVLTITLTTAPAPPLLSAPDNFGEDPSATTGPQNRLECRTCSYQFLIDTSIYERRRLRRKEVEDVMGGRDAWANVDRTDVQCPREGCDGSHAFFYQVQIRSADEPMTTFYKCTTCGQRWKEN